MKFSYLLAILVSGFTFSLACLTNIKSASAVTLNYDLNDQFVDGGTYSGAFSTDTGTQSVTAYSITTTASSTNSNFRGFSYRSGVPGNSVGYFPFFPSVGLVGFNLTPGTDGCPVSSSGRGCSL